MDSQSYKTRFLNKDQVQKQWHLVDATGQPLGRLASRIALIARGKHKPGFTPHVDCGDKVVVINADKVKLTGRKLQQHTYVWYTGYPSGQRSETAEETLRKHPERLIERAVRRMLPKNRLGRRQFFNVKVYAGDQHPHEAQEPQPLELKL